MPLPPGEPPPFLDQDPPAWAARALPAVLLLLFAVTVAALFLVQVPETVSAVFALESLGEADPVRALHPGIVSEVKVTEAQQVAQGDLLFVLASELVGDRASERQAVSARLSGGRDRRQNERQKFDSQRFADDQERRRLEQRLSALERRATFTEQQLALTKDIAARQQRAFDEGVTSWMEANRPRLEVDRLSVELEQVRAEIDDARNALARLTFEMAARLAAYTEVERQIGEEEATFQARKSVLDQDSAREGNALAIPSPCAGTVVKLHVQNAGAVVSDTDVLAELVCADRPLQAVLMVPERGMALVRIGQPVKLLYDAFPYQRYGVQYGTLRWVSPASSAGPSGTVFRAFADLQAGTVPVQGSARAVMPGMTGRAAVIVGRRSLASYAFEPLRQIRESMASAPPESP